MKHLIVGVGLLLAVVVRAEEKTCAALRGNGQLMLAHFGALARITETYGVLDGMAGGSSGSITTFLYESILMNPAVNNCHGKPCSKEERARRAALLLKAAPEVIEVMKKSPEALAVKELMKLKAEISARGIGALLEQGNTQAATQALTTLSRSREFGSAWNPEVTRLLQQGRAQEVYDQIMKFGEFKADDPAIFFRPGFINFKSAPYIFGKVADFYAGRGPVNQTAMASFLDSCAKPESVGKDWWELGEPCQKKFSKQYTDFRRKYDTAPQFNHRSDDKIGGSLPALVSTSVLEGQTAANNFRETREQYLNSRTLNPRVEYNPGWDKIKFGYWGKPSDLSQVQEKMSQSNDAKAKKFLSLGEGKWADALKTSPAEPGIASGQEIDSTHISFGGWSDLHPVQALKAMGCTRVIYVTRKGPESSFAVGVARLLGMTQADEDKLFTLKASGEPSSQMKAIKMADAIWCTDWNNSVATDTKATFQEAYKAPLVTQNEYFQVPMQGSPARVMAEYKVEGCDGTTASPVTAVDRTKPLDANSH